MAKNGSGNGKRIMIGVGIVVLVAIIIVVVLLCIPPNTYNAVQMLNKTSQNMFLSNAQERAYYYDFRDNLEVVKKDGKTDSAYATELDDIVKTSIALSTVYNYYNDNILFASSNKNLKKNYKPIKNNLQDVLEKKEELVAILKKGANLESVGTTYMRNLFIDLRSKFVSYLNSCRLSLNALSAAYKGSMGSVLVNNTASTLVLNATNDYVTVLYNELKDLKNNDLKSVSVNNYDYTLNYKVAAFAYFADTYMYDGAEGSIIGQYYFTTSTKDKVDKCNKFYSLFKEKNFRAVISGITSFHVYSTTVTLSTSKTYDTITDTEHVYDDVKKFLGGNL